MRINRHTSLLLAAAVALAVAAPAAADKTNDPQGAKDQANSTLGFYDCEGEDGYTTNPEDVAGEDHIEFFGDDVMWPPNHKTQTMEIIARAGDDTETVTVYTDSTHDEFFTNEEGDPEELNGAGNTSDDAEDAAGSQDVATDTDGDGEVRTNVTLRSERSGRGDGRTYEIDSFATFDDQLCMDGQSSSGGEDNVDDDEAVNFFVHVPHDMRSDQGAANGKNGGASLDENGAPKGGGNS